MSGSRRRLRPPVLAAGPLLALLVCAALLGGACLYEGRLYDVRGQDVGVSLIHTADIHSRILPYEMLPGYNDRSAGLRTENGPYGGIARLATLIGRDRRTADRILHLDTGDVFQGAPIFNYFLGEPELRSLSALGLDAFVVGNHEFDAGKVNLASQLIAHASFPLLNANYRWPDPDRPGGTELRRLVQPFAIFNLKGLKVGVIGLGDFGSMASLGNRGNSLGIDLLDTFTTVQGWIDVVEPQVDLVILATHVGPSSDVAIIENTRGLDVVLGGHLHIAFDPPKILHDLDGRPVVLCHSGAFLKYYGRLDAVVHVPAAGEDAPHGAEVISHRYALTPVSRCDPAATDFPRFGDAGCGPEDELPDDPRLTKLLDPYVQELALTADLQHPVGFASETLARFGRTGGDAPLGNLVAEAMQLRQSVQTDFGVTNSLGIRTDVPAGPITTEVLFNVLPFENTITKMILSGGEVSELFDYVAQRSASRGCQAQAQISGATILMVCDTEHSERSCAEEVTIGGSLDECDEADDRKRWTGDEAGYLVGAELCGRLAQEAEVEAPRLRGACPADGECCTGRELCVSGRCRELLNPNGSYELATNDYIASGGSGFDVLERNTTRFDTGIPIRDGFAEYIGRQLTCEGQARERLDRSECDDLPGCSPLRECLGAFEERRLRACRGIDGEGLVGDDAHERCAGSTGGSTLAECQRIAACAAVAACRLSPCVTASPDGRIRRVLRGSE